MKTAGLSVQNAVWMFLLITVLSASGRADDESAAASANCQGGERYCAHKVATFSEGGASVPVYEDGQCLPQSHSCSDFWCGPRRCTGGLFGKQVCCVKMSPGQDTQYSCALS